MLNSGEPYPIPDQCESAEQDCGSQSQDDFLISNSIINFLADYQYRLAALGKLIRLEWKLSLRSLFFIFLLTICFSLSLVLFWIGLNLLLGSMLINLGLSFAASLSIVLAIQAVVIFGLWLSIKDLSKRVGFRRSIATLSDEYPSQRE